MHRRFLATPCTAILTVVLALALSAGVAQAQDTFWTNTVSGQLTDVNNWDNGVPGPTTNVIYAVPGATYTVTWTGTSTNVLTTISNQNQNITWDLGGFTNYLTQLYAGTALRISPNTTDTNHLTIINGYVKGGAGNPSYLSMTGYGSTVTVSNGARADFNLSVGGYLTPGGTLTVTGPGSYFHASDSANVRHLNVLDGAAAFMRNGTDINFVTVDGATLTNASSTASVAGDLVQVINGGLLTTRTFEGHGFGQHTAGLSTVTVGRASDVLTSVLESPTYITLNRSTADHRTDVYLNINSNGVVRLLTPRAAQGAGIVMYTDAATYGRSDFYVNDKSVVTLDDGKIEMTYSNYLDLANQAKIMSYQPANNPGLLRGTGQIIRTNVGANFQIRNDGWIKPGDVGDTPGLGVLAITGGDLLMTNAAASNAGLYFEFSDTALDQITLSGGVATLTHGSNVFALAAGSAVPTPGVKWGLGTYDFITADGITYTPVYDNLTNLLAGYGLTQNLDYRFGVVDLGTYQALRLEFVPEPSTVLLLLGGGLVLWRVRRKA